MSNENEKVVLIYAPISLSHGINDIISSYISKNKKLIVKPVFMGTSHLALQIKNGAKPDIFISANNDWMDYLENKKLIF